MSPGNPAYNMPVAYHLSGSLDVQALASGLGEIVRRHESLRTTFFVRNGEPLQLIHPAFPIRIILRS